MEREVENLKGILEEKTAKIAFLQKETRVQQEKMYYYQHFIEIEFPF